MPFKLPCKRFDFFEPTHSYLQNLYRKVTSKRAKPSSPCSFPGSKKRLVWVGNLPPDIHLMRLRRDFESVGDLDAATAPRMHDFFCAQPSQSQFNFFGIQHHKLLPTCLHDSTSHCLSLPSPGQVFPKNERSIRGCLAPDHPGRVCETPCSVHEGRCCLLLFKLLFSLLKVDLCDRRELLPLTFLLSVGHLEVDDLL